MLDMGMGEQQDVTEGVDPFRSLLIALRQDAGRYLDTKGQAGGRNFILDINQRLVQLERTGNPRAKIISSTVRDLMDVAQRSSVNTKGVSFGTLAHTLMQLTQQELQKVATQQGVAEGTSLSVEQLAHISDKALDDAYHYGRSTPGANFGWMANIQSAKAAKRLIDAGETDIEKISDAIHQGWNVTAAADYKGKLQLDTPTPDEKKLKRAKLAMQSYSQLPEEEKEKDRVVARALLQAINGDTLEEGPFVQRIVNPNKINIYIKPNNNKPPLLIATDIPYALLDKYINKAISKYPQFKQTDFSFKSADRVIAETNLSESADYLEEK
jgi:hypothetical protein